MTKHESNHPHSSSIQKCEYDEETKEMHITFATGGRHKFKKVEKEDYDALTKADSLGKHFHLNIRRKFESEKVD